MRTAAVVLLVLCGAVLAAPVPKVKKPPTLEEQLLGKWRLVANRGMVVPNSTFHMVFLKGGELEFRYEGRGVGAQPVSAGTYTLGEPDDENKYGTFEWTVTQNGLARAEKDRITELSDDALEIIDPNGIVQRYERVKEENKGR